MRPLTYATVCSGIECMSAAVPDLPMKPIFFSEIEPFPCAVLKHRFPNVPNLGDMSRIEVTDNGMRITNGRTTIALERNLDVFAGGTPCQDVSNAGKKAGMAEGSGTRSSLAFEFVRLVRSLRPRYVIWENVAGVISDESFPKFLSALADCGYGVAYRTLDAQYIRTSDIHHKDGRVVPMERAVPQRRRRVWVVGCAGEDLKRASEILFEPQCVCGNRPPRRITGQGTAEAARVRARLPDCVVGRANGFYPYEPGGVKSLNLDHAWTLINGSCPGCHHGVVVEMRGVSFDGGFGFPVEKESISGTLHNNTCPGHCNGVVEVYENHAQDCRVKPCGEVAQTINGKMGTGGNNVPLKAEFFGVFDMGARKTGCGTDTSGVSPTILAAHGTNPHAVCFGINTNGVTKTAQMPFRENCAETLAVRHMGGVVMTNSNGEDVSPTLSRDCRSTGNQIEKNGGYVIERRDIIPNAASTRYIVRRLTPTECERLQGLPDGWTLPAFAPGDITDALVAEFQRIHDTFGAIMASYAGKNPPRPKTAAWVRTWLERISDHATCPDAPRYKACGNGWATNQPRWIILRVLAKEWIDQ